MQSKFPLSKMAASLFPQQHSFLTNSLLRWLYTHKSWKRSAEKYKSCGTLSKTIHFLSVFFEGCVVQQWTRAQAGVIQDVCIKLLKLLKVQMSRPFPKGKGVGGAQTRVLGKDPRQTAQKSVSHIRSENQQILTRSKPHLPTLAPKYYRCWLVPCQLVRMLISMNWFWSQSKLLEIVLKLFSALCWTYWSA